MRRWTKQLPLSGEFTKRGKEVVNYGGNFLTFVARGTPARGLTIHSAERAGDIQPEFI
ncbi:hypothetical protein [Rhizobium sp. X9]|uniref:hypothetical protein n=1 Tax=Rhizobium sp. X9 TaxID=2815360 RepID=UPI001C0D8232|nr:hypothetical protein [Rhizobium sp. X9]